MKRNARVTRDAPARAIEERIARGFVAAVDAMLAAIAALPFVVHLTVDSSASERLAVRATITDGRGQTVPFVAGESLRELAYKLELLLTNRAGS